MSGRTTLSYLLAALLAPVLSSAGFAQYYPGTAPGSAPIQPCTSDLRCARGTKTGMLEGKWVREVMGFAMAATATGDELKMCLSQTVGDAKIAVTLTAEYTLTKDGLVYGVITGADLMKQDPKASVSIISEGGLSELLLALQHLVDCPFSFRTRITSEGLMVSNVKLAVGEQDLKGFVVTKELLSLLGGMYKQSNAESLPLTKARDAATGTNIANGQRQLARPYDKDFVEQYYKTEFDTAGHQSPPASPPPSVQAPAKILDMDRPARMITLKECIAIALGQANVDSQIPLELGSKLEIPKIQPGTGIMNQRIGLNIQINYLLANTEVAYWNLFAAYHNLNAQEEGLRQAYLGYRFTDTRATVGTDTSCNRDQSRAQFERFRRMVIDARGQVAESERQLRGLLGLRSDDGKRLVPSDEPSIALNTPDFQAAATEAMANRPEILQCRQDLKVQQLNLALQQNLRRPDLRFISGYSITGLGTRDASQCPDESQTIPGNAFKQLAGNQYQNWTISPRITMPLGFRDANAQVREAQLNVARSYYQLRDTELKVMEYLVQQYRQVIQTHADIAPARAEREALQNYIAKVKTLISDGKFKSEDFLNYLTVQQQMATAISTEYQAIANYRNALATFEFAKGTIQKHHEICVFIEEDRLHMNVQKENVIEFKVLTASAQSWEVSTLPLQLTIPAMTAPTLRPLPPVIEFRVVTAPLAPLTPPQPMYPCPSPEKTLAPAPREVSTLPLQLTVPVMTAPTLPPLEFPIELPH